MCSVEDCEVIGPLVRGLCPRHYARFKRHGDPLVCKKLPPGSEPYDSILKHGVLPWGECLIYQGKTNGASGYGMTYGKLLAHRVVYEKWWGAITPGMWIDHICHNEAASRGECRGGLGCPHRKCINPGHLRLKSPSRNSLDSPLHGGKTHCLHGHEYTPENTYIQPQSRGHGMGRVCRECRRDQSRLRQHSHRGN
jgi:hypothetical protein